MAQSMWTIKIGNFVGCVMEAMDSGMTLDQAIEHARSMAEQMDSAHLVAAEAQARRDVAWIAAAEVGR